MDGYEGSGHGQEYQRAPMSHMGSRYPGRGPRGRSRGGSGGSRSWAYRSHDNANSSRYYRKGEIAPDRYNPLPNEDDHEGYERSTATTGYKSSQNRNNYDWDNCGGGGGVHGTNNNSNYWDTRGGGGQDVNENYHSGKPYYYENNEYHGGSGWNRERRNVEYDPIQHHHHHHNHNHHHNQVN